MDDFMASYWENLASGIVMMEQDIKMLGVKVKCLPLRHSFC